MNIKTIVLTYIISNISFEMLPYYEKKRILIVSKKSKQSINNELDYICKICNFEFVKNNTSQTATNYIKEYGSNTTLSSFMLEKNDYSKDYKKDYKRCQLLLMVDKVDNYNKYKLENQKKLSIIEYLKSQKISKKTTKKHVKKESSQEVTDSQLSNINNNIDSLIDTLEALNNEEPNNDSPVNTVEKIEIEDYDNYNYNYSNDANLINLGKLDKIKQIREDLKELLTEKLDYLYKVYNCKSLIELQVIANNNDFLTEQLNDIDQINIDFEFFKGSTKNVKKQLTKDLPLLKFSDDKNLDFIPILNGLDSYVKYFLKDRKVYNYTNFCDTYDININELRNEANLVMLENLDKIEDEIEFYNCNSYCELNKEDKKAVNSLVANILRKKIDNFCQIISNVVTVPVDEYNNFKKLRHAKKLNSMQSTNYEVEKRLAKTRLNSGVGNDKKESSNRKLKRSMLEKKARITIVDASETKVDIKIEFLKELKLFTENNTLYKSNYYTSIIAPLNKNIEIKEACTNEAPVLKLDSNMIEIMKNYYILDLKFFEKLNNKQIAKILKTSNNNIKHLLDGALQACKVDLHDYLYSRNLKSALRDKMNSELMQKLTSLIY